MRDNMTPWAEDDIAALEGEAERMMAESIDRARASIAEGCSPEEHLTAELVEKYGFDPRDPEEIERASKDLSTLEASVKSMGGGDYVYFCVSRHELGDIRKRCRKNLVDDRPHPIEQLTNALNKIEELEARWRKCQTTICPVAVTDANRDPSVDAFKRMATDLALIEEALVTHGFVVEYGAPAAVFAALQALSMAERKR